MKRLEACDYRQAASLESSIYYGALSVQKCLASHAMKTRKTPQ